MKSYTIAKTKGIPDWRAIPAVEIDIPYQKETFGIRSFVQLCWDDSCIHVHLRAVEKNIRQEYTGVLDMVCEDSCLEFFIRPTEALYYFNFEFNPNGALFLGYATDRNDGVRLIVHDQQELFHPQVRKTEDGWEITYQIPFAFIQHFLPQFAPQEGTQLYGNFYKCADLGETPHHFSWAPIRESVLDFHCPECFGHLILGGDTV